MVRIAEVHPLSLPVSVRHISRSPTQQSTVTIVEHLPSSHINYREARISSLPTSFVVIVRRRHQSPPTQDTSSCCSAKAPSHPSLRAALAPAPTHLSFSLLLGSILFQHISLENNPEISEVTPPHFGVALFHLTPHLSPTPQATEIQV